MADERNVREPELSDAELVEALKNYGVSRRLLMKVFGAGAIVSATGGTASATPGKGGGKQIDKYYGASYSADENVPPGRVDHTVALKVVDTSDENSDIHPGFPIDPESDPAVEIPAEFFFDPVGLHVNPGGIVEFYVENELHTVTSFDPKYGEEELALPKRVPTDYAFTSPPVVDGDSWLYQFTKPGVYDLLCLPHVFLGMVMRVVVSGDGNVPTDDYGDLEIPNAGTVLSAPELTPSNIVEKGTVSWAEVSL